MHFGLQFSLHNFQQKHQVPGRRVLRIKKQTDVPNKDSLENAKASRKVWRLSSALLPAVAALAWWWSSWCASIWWEFGEPWRSASIILGRGEPLWHEIAELKFNTKLLPRPCDKWVPVTTAWCVLRLRMEEEPPMWRVAVNILNKQLRTADKGWFSNLGVGQGASNSSLLKYILLWNIHRQNIGPGLLLWYDLRNKRGTWDLVDCVWNVMAHAQKPDFVFQRNRWVHLNQQGRQFSRLLAAEVCASAFIFGSNAGYTMFRGGVKGTGYPLHLPVSPSLPLLCVTVCHHVSTGVYLEY